MKFKRVGNPWTPSDIRRFGKSKYWSRRVFAKKMGVCRRTIMNWELGHNRPRDTSLARLNELYREA